MAKTNKNERRKDKNGIVLRQGETQLANGSYMYRLRKYDGIDENGKKKYSYGACLYAKTLVELREKEKNVQRDIADELKIFDAQKITLNDMFVESMKAKKKLRESTKQNYINLWNNNIRDDFGQNRISKIRKIHVERLYREFEERGLAKNTIKIYHQLIHSSLELAVENDLLRRNPADGAEYDGEIKKREALTRREQESLVSFLESETIYNIYRPLITVFLGTGLRTSELCGLTWADVDFCKNEISVNHQLLKRKTASEDGKTLYIERTKTNAGTRVIPMTTAVRNALLDQRALNMELGRRGFAEIDGFTDFCFVTKNNTPFCVTNIDFILKNIVKAHNKVNEFQLPHFSAHILRHTALTRLAESGIPPKALQTIAGHSKIEITMNVYVNLDGEHIAEEMQKAEKILQYKSLITA